MLDKKEEIKMWRKEVIEKKHINEKKKRAEWRYQIDVIVLPNT